MKPRFNAIFMREHGRRHLWKELLLLSLWAVIFLRPSFVPAQQPPAQQPPSPAVDMTALSIEDLMNLKVTSVSKDEQTISQAAAAIFVITQADIRNSGASNIPDLLRMVPGMEVSQINANTWAISVRGFNTQFGNKLLVLIDGRAVYSPILGGVYWDTQDVPLGDIERIEVIRGPGAALWGANAVNGVINIISKKAGDTPGILAVVGGGTTAQAFGTAQYGGKIREGASYRVFTKYLDHNHFPDLAGQNARDNWHLLHGGFRVDQSLSKKDSLTTEGDLYAGNEGASIIHLASISPPEVTVPFVIAGLSGGNVLTRWDHSFSARSDTSLQFYFDDYTRSGPEARENRHTFDFDFTHHLSAGAHQELVWGAGFRRSSDQTVGTIDQAWVPTNRTLKLFNVFGQDTIPLKPDRLFLTVGTKVEHNDFSGFEIQPSVRAAWTPGHQQTFWAAVSRAARTPTRKSSDLNASLAAFDGPDGTPVQVILFGSPTIKSEHLIAYEAGYRTQFNDRVSIDIAAFFNTYSNLESLDPQEPHPQATPLPARIILPIVFDNDIEGSTSGGEVAAHWSVFKRWTLSPSYSLLQVHLRPDADREDVTTPETIEGSNPTHQAQLRSHVNLGHGLAWDASANFVGPLPSQLVPGYTRADTQLSWQVNKDIRLSIIGQNLVHDHHLESNDSITLVNPSLVKRGVYAKFVWRFP